MVQLLELPVELLQHTLNYGRGEDLKNLAICNKTLYQMTKKPLWRKVTIFWENLLNVDWRDPINKKRLQNLRLAKSLQFLDSSNTDNYVFDDDFRFVGADDFGDLLRGEWSMDKVKEIFANYKRVLLNCKVDGVEELEINRGGVLLSYACSVLVKLKKINLFDVNHILSVCNNSESKAEKYTSVDRNPMVMIRKLNHLVEFRAFGSNFHSSDMLYLCTGSVEQLKVLDLGSNCYCLDDKGVFYVKRFSNLEELNLSACEITNACMPSICSLQKLHTLNMSYTDITDSGIEELTQLRLLVHLNLSGCITVTDRGAYHISSLPLLKSLHMKKTCISDAGIMDLVKLKSLVRLVISHCKNVTAHCLTYIKDMKSLQILDISGNDQLTLVDLLATLAGHPSLKEIYRTGFIVKIDGIIVLNQEFED